jgi:hypothetical protein
MGRYRFSRRSIHWRRSVDAHRFVRCLLAEFSLSELARLCGVSVSTIHRWKEGTSWPTAGALHRLVDALLPQSAGWIPIYSPEMAIDGGTRVGGVGEFTRRAAQGDTEYVGASIVA